MGRQSIINQAINEATNQTKYRPRFVTDPLTAVSLPSRSVRVVCSSALVVCRSVLVACSWSSKARSLSITRDIPEDCCLEVSKVTTASNSLSSHLLEKEIWVYTCIHIWLVGWLAECCFTSTENVGWLGTEAQDGHLDFHTTPKLCPH